MLALWAMTIKRFWPVILLSLLFFAACVPEAQSDTMRIILVADGRQRAYAYDQQVSVGQFLEQVGVSLGELDRVNPPEVTQIRDGMTITVVRVEEEIDCEENPIPYQRNIVAIEGLSPGEERLAQAGVNGTEEVCYRTTFEDGEQQQRVEIRRVVVEAPQDEIVWVGIDTANLGVVPITGSLAYISNGNAWIMRGSSATKRPLTDSGALDGRVFALSPDGNQLLYTERFSGEDEEEGIYFNTLWTILDTGADEPAPLSLSLLSNILYAEWVPNQPFTFSYSTAEARDAAPGWQAFNDLWLIRINEDSGDLMSPRNLVEASSGGVYGWWGTQFRWAPDGSALAWARADSVGLVDLDTGDFQRLLEFPVYTTFQDWVWQPSLSWSPDGLMLITTVHGPPFGSEQPENSPIFNIAVARTDNSFHAEIVEQAGIWAAPQFSPFVEHDGEFPQGYIAYLQARNPLNSLNDQYDLVVADRDGSNARTIFPEPDQPGLPAQELAWSPDGHQIAFIYQGNLWIVDVSSGRAQQITVDGGASLPRWAP